MKKLVTLLGIGCLPFLTSGCLLFILTGFEGCVDPTDGKVSIRLAAVQITECETYKESPTSEKTNVFCSNQVNNEETTVFDSFLTLSGSTGNFFLDPVVLQVPADGTSFAAKLTPATPLLPVDAVIQAGLTCVDTQPGEQLCAEAGQQLVIFDVPPGTPPGQYEIEVSFFVAPPRSIEVKPVITGKVQSGSTTYYPVLVPCVTDMADAPGITIQLASVPGFIPLDLPDLSQIEACQGELNFPASGTTMAPAASPLGMAMLALAIASFGAWRLRSRRQR